MQTPNSALQLAASVQLHACLPNVLAQEQNPVNAWYENGTLSYGKGYFKDPLVLGPDGCVEVPRRPGLGVELDEDGMKEIMAMPWRPGRA